MGTRCLTHIHDEGIDSPVLTVIYRQHDGYPEGHGKELADLLEPLHLVNGISSRHGGEANGTGCLAATIIAHFKEGVGSFYVYRPDVGDCGEDYVYRVYKGEQFEMPIEGRSHTKEAWRICVRVLSSGGEQLFDGPASDLKAWIIQRKPEND